MHLRLSDSGFIVTIFNNINHMESTPHGHSVYSELGLDVDPDHQRPLATASGNPNLFSEP